MQKSQPLPGGSFVPGAAAQAPAAPRPCPAARGGFPGRSRCHCRPGSPANPPPRAASRLFTFKFAFSERPRRKQTGGIASATGVCLSGSRDIASYLSEGSLWHKAAFPGSLKLKAIRPLKQF